MILAYANVTGWDVVITVLFIIGCVVALLQSYPGLKWGIWDSRPVEWARYKLWPRQWCNHCSMRFTTWTPWRTYYCDHPNCQEQSLHPDTDW